MNFEEYNKQFEAILNGQNSQAPYNNEAYLNYVKLNQGRIKRWHKKGRLSADLELALQKITSPQKWVFISEPWCGDAAHVQAFVEMASAVNPLVEIVVQNRDEDSEIDKYLTNGGKSIPKLVVRDANGNDLFDWGPRPAEAQELFYAIKDDEAMTMEDKKIALQQWYNKDKGSGFMQELLGLLNSLR